MPTTRLISRTTLALGALCALMLQPSSTEAQDLHPSRRPSPMAMARTTLDDAYVRVVYSRPYKRGRDNIFGSEESGALVPYGVVWRTGANEATEITLTRDLEVGGQSLAAGTYSLFTTPGPESWTFHFNSALGLAGMARQNPESGEFETVDLEPTEVLAVEVPAGSLDEEVDQFTISFAEAEDGSDMCLRWILTEACLTLRLPSE